jgi:hypothetical protein
MKKSNMAARCTHKDSSGICQISSPIGTKIALSHLCEETPVVPIVPTSTTYFALTWVEIEDDSSKSAANFWEAV